MLHITRRRLRCSYRSLAYISSPSSGRVLAIERVLQRHVSAGQHTLHARHFSTNDIEVFGVSVVDNSIS